MNELIIKRASIFSLILGAFIGIASIIPPFIGLAIFILSFLSSPLVISYMRKNERFVSFLTNQEGAILGGIIGLFATFGFFATFCPLVCIIKLIFKKYYAYMIPDVLSSALWLFVVIVVMVGLIFAMTNSATGMATTWVMGYFIKQPQDSEARLDIEIND